MHEVHVRGSYNARMDMQRHEHARKRTQQVRDVSMNVWTSRKCGRAWACMHASQKDVRARLVGTRTHGRAETSSGRAGGARQTRERHAVGARLALDWHYSPESDDFARNALIDLK
ncbi:hypothetical protein CRG98_041991 [Punica granatum]|uniref:Uncharacterized protein n=1 Tax=Punica granatum TaxID=22663 RepID=A0A2I0I165_PUNGR|nr:hypothetical protein CRG98_041991 [Punica granatum]